MGDKEKVIGEKLKYSGLGNFKDAYQFIYGLLSDRGFDIVEESYGEKVGADGKEVEVVWACSRGVTDYYKMHIKVKIKVKGMTDVEVEVDGRKQKMNKFGEFAVEIAGTLEKDPKGEWSKTPFNKFLRESYDKYIAREKTSKREGEIVDTVQGLKEEVKAFLDLTGRK